MKPFSRFAALRPWRNTVETRREPGLLTGSSIRPYGSGVSTLTDLLIAVALAYGEIAAAASRLLACLNPWAGRPRLPALHRWCSHRLGTTLVILPLGA